MNPQTVLEPFQIRATSRVVILSVRTSTKYPLFIEHVLLWGFGKIMTKQIPCAKLRFTLQIVGE